jgi:hypothetical protein
MLRAVSASQANQLGIETRGKGGRVPASALVGSRAETTFAEGVAEVDPDEAVRVRPYRGRLRGQRPRVRLRRDSPVRDRAEERREERQIGPARIKA